jgi:hypothetical protein
MRTCDETIPDGTDQVADRVAADQFDRNAHCEPDVVEYSTQKPLMPTALPPTVHEMGNELPASTFPPPLGEITAIDVPLPPVVKLRTLE